MKRTLLIIVSCVLFAVLVAGSWFTWKHYQDTNVTYIYINEVRYLRAETQLDLSDQGYPEIAAISQMESLRRLDLRGTGLTPEDYDLLRQALPECNILWDIPFQGDYYDENTSHLTVSELKQEDLDRIAYFKNLRMVNADACRDYEVILALQERYPDCQVSYVVPVSGEDYRKDTASLTAKNPVLEELRLALTYLPRLNSVHLTGELPDAEALYELVDTYPQIAITWEVELHGVTFQHDAAEIDLSDIQIDSVETVEASLDYFPNLERVVMCRCGIPNEEMDALNRRHENIRFVWSIFVGTAELRTDVTVFMPFQFGYAGDNKLYDEHCTELKYCTDLICLDMGHMRISDCSFLYYMPNMKYLILAETNITDITPVGSLKELVYLEMFITNVTDFSPLLNCTKLEDLNMCWTWPTNLEVLKDMPNLKNLWLIGAKYPNWALYELMEALPNTHFAVAELGSSTGFGWRKLPNYYAQRDLLNMKYMYG